MSDYSPQSFSYGLLTNFIAMISCFTSFYSFQEPENSPFRCIVEAFVNMMPSNNMVKLVIFEYLSQYPLSLASREAVFQWIYNLILKFRSVNIVLFPYRTYDEFRNDYNQHNISKEKWGNPTWFCMHDLTTYHDDTNEYFMNYKAFISCLQYLLPCPMCKNHLVENLKNHPIDQYNSKTNLFIWSYILHQRVSSQTNKAGITLDQAFRLYYR